MALTGLDIYKLLPKTNCKKCGFPTCLAFAMALAAKKASLEKCPDISEESKASLDAASEPPIRTVTLGSEKNKVETGGETVLFRHEKTFYHPCGLSVTFSDNLSQNELSEKISKFNSLEFERVGQKVRVEFITLKNDSNDSGKFATAVNQIKSSSSANLILLSENLQSIENVLKLLNGKRPVIGPVNSENLNPYTALAKTYNAILLVTGKDLDETAQNVQKIASSGLREIIIEVKTLQELTDVRRLALKKNFRPLGYPVAYFTTAKDPYIELSQAAAAIEKYAGLVVLSEPEPWIFLPLVTLRQNIYTDPQKPVTVEPKLYTIGGQPNDKSPLLVTTNFSLTYFTVEPEILNAKMPAYLLVVDTDGLSVLTAWAAEKFGAERIVDAMKKAGIENAVSHRKIIIPGYVAVMSGKLVELSGWEVLVGPREAGGIPKFLRTMWQA
ncbi:MAG: acetyl-CoA decarbonylase/synthase complex subunit gamma [Elusimicrobiota bacterium]